jgi:hypothetical protein
VGEEDLPAGHGSRTDASLGEEYPRVWLASQKNESLEKVFLLEIS